MQDSWIDFFTVNETDFWDYTPFNADTFDVDKDSTSICEIYWRLSGDQINHVRVAYSIMDWIGDMGGVPGIM